MVTGAEPVLVSLPVGSQGSSTRLCWVAELGTAALRAVEEGRGWHPLELQLGDTREGREGQEEKWEATWVCGATAKQDYPQRLHTAWYHPQSLAGFVVMG